MSVRINPCHGCPVRRSGCDLVNEFKSRVSGLGLRSATFRCDTLKRAIAPGTRIEISQPYIDYNNSRNGYHDYGYTIERIAVPATIHHSDGVSFTCVVDKAAFDKIDEKYGNQVEDGDDRDKFRFRKTMKASNIIRFLPEPRRKICDFGNVLDEDGSCDQRGDTDEYSCCRKMSSSLLREFEDNLA